MEETPFKSGFIALLGRPNVGKSTLLNALLGQKVAIVSEKVQTTRTQIRGIKSLPQAQLIFVDTPGIHKASLLLNRLMVREALKAAQDVDLILLMTDEQGELESPEGDGYILGSLKPGKVPVFLVINKVDLIRKDHLLVRIDTYNRAFPFAETFPISALEGENLDRLQEKIVAYLPPGPRYFPEEMVTDQPEEFWLSELIREKVIELTRQEVPYAVAVTVERVEERANGVLHVEATLYVERESQKGILIGKGGQMLKRVGETARREMEAFLGVPIYLSLWVKVRKDWRKDQPFLTRELGLS